MELRVEKILKIDPNIQIVLCSGYCEKSWEEIHNQLGSGHRLLILNKPFDKIEIQQLAHSQMEKWQYEKLIKSQTKNYCSLEK